MGFLGIREVSFLSARFLFFMLLWGFYNRCHFYIFFGEMQGKGGLIGIGSLRDSKSLLKEEFIYEMGEIDKLVDLEIEQNTVELKTGAIVSIVVK